MKDEIIIIGDELRIGNKIWYGMSKEILDLITNLQQENEYKDKLIDIANAGIEYLQQENERLKEANVYCNRTDCVGRIKDSRKYDSVYQEKEDYKSRCEKAIEYNNQIIKDTRDFYRPTTDIIYSGDCLIDIAKNNINILQNGSDS